MSQNFKSDIDSYVTLTMLTFRCTKCDELHVYDANEDQSVVGLCHKCGEPIIWQESIGGGYEPRQF